MLNGCFDTGKLTLSQPGFFVLLVALFVSFGRYSSIKTQSSSSYSDSSCLSSLCSSPFELTSEHHRWKTAFHGPFSFRIFQPCGMAYYHPCWYIMPYYMADWKISGALGTGRSEVNPTRVMDLQMVWLNITWRFRASDWSLPYKPTRDMW